MPSKQKSTQNSTSTYTALNNNTPATDKLQTMVQQGSDPSIPYSYAQRREDYNNTFQNPLGAATSPAVRDAANRVGGMRMSQDENNAIQTSNYRNNQAGFDRQATVAGLTAPQYAQTGSTGSSTQSSFNPMSIIGAGASLGSMAM